jgi:hypothetical protein
MTTKRDIEIGELHVKTSKIRVTDPCYDPETTPSRCFTVIGKVKKGIWKCVATVVDMPTCGKRVSELWMHHSDIDELEYGDDYVDYVTVDSGQCGFFFNNDFKKLYKDRERSDEWYDMVCEENQNEGIILDEGVVTSSGLGDGAYDVFVSEDEDGNVESIRVVFIDLDEEGEDWVWATD